MLRIGLPAAFVLLVIGWTASAQPAASTFDFTLDQPTPTSAGIYDGRGRLVRVLWTMKELPAGKQTGAWDGNDDFGQAAPAGEYQFRVLLNHTTYRNVGAIGNSGPRPTEDAHTPAGMLSVCADAAGNVYTANGWDETGHDFKQWKPDGTPGYHAHYQIRNGKPNGMPYAIACDEQYLYCAVGGWAHKEWNEAQQIQRFRLSDGQEVKFTAPPADAPSIPGAGPATLVDGHIQIYQWPSQQIAEGAPPEDAARMKLPLRALAVSKDTIFCADYLGNRILKFHKETGQPLGSFAVRQPAALALDKLGRVWVGHEHHLVDVYAPDGSARPRVLRDLGEVEALAFDPAGLLLVADSGAGQVKLYDLNGRQARLARTLGQKADPGDRAADHFYHLRGVAPDREGNLFTIQTEPIGGARVAKFDPRGNLLWEHFGAEFVSLGNYGPSDPDTLYSMTFHRYRLLDRKAAPGQWEYLGNTFPMVQLPAGAPRHTSDPHGTIRVFHAGGDDWVAFPTGDGVQLYRVVGPALRLATILGGKDPGPAGKREDKPMQWVWHDRHATGEVKSEEVQWYRQPGDAKYAVFGMDVDRAGNVWYAELHSKGIWFLPLGAPDEGVPTYEWAQAREVVPKDTSALKFEPQCVRGAEDGSFYAFGWSAPWPAPKNNPFWMGGSTLVHYAKDGTRLWAVPLPEPCVGLDTIPVPPPPPGAGPAGNQPPAPRATGRAELVAPGGCIVGGAKSAKLYHYSADGLLLGAVGPGDAMAKKSGWMDNQASVAVSRDPRDRILDVFAEDDYLLRIGWYRIDERELKAIVGSVKR